MSNTYTYNPDDELTQASNDAECCTYDANGNLTHASSTNGVITSPSDYVYDQANRLTHVDNNNGGIGFGLHTVLSYDGDGLLRSRGAGSGVIVTTTELWDINNPMPQLAWERGSSSEKARYLYGPSRLSETTSAGTFYYHTDRLGSVAALTSSAGAEQTSTTYEPYGTATTTTVAPSPPGNIFGFTGEQSPGDALHLRARSYLPAVGRFLQRDPIDAATDEPYTGSYVYVADRPTVMLDPTGETFTPSGAATSAAGEATTRTPQFVCSRSIGGHCYPAPRLSAAEMRRLIVEAAWLGFYKRDKIHYSQDGWKRMEGVNDLVFPPHVPIWADCSGFATWAYFVATAPDPNGLGYNGKGYTGTLASNGHLVSLAHAKPADLAFYGNPALVDSHVAIYIGNGRVIGMGKESDPQVTAYNWRNDFSYFHAYLGG